MSFCVWLLAPHNGRKIHGRCSRLSFAHSFPTQPNVFVHLSLRDIWVVLIWGYYEQSFFKSFYLFI